MFNLPLAPSMISIAKPMTLKNPANDGPLHVLYYPPQNPNYQGIVGERPPCIVDAHGGPNTGASQGFKWEVQFFTSRGFAWYVRSILPRQISTTDLNMTVG